MKNMVIAFAPLSAESLPAYVEKMQFKVLGTVEVDDDGRQCSLGGKKQRTVLAVLIANAGSTVSVDRLIESTWGESSPEGARRSLQTYVSNLRNVFGDVITGQGSGYRLETDRSSIDAMWFEDEVLAAQAMVDEPGAAAERLRSALALWRGHPYDDVDGGPELDLEIARLNELRVAALGARIDADLLAGRHRELIGELDALTEEYPLREQFRARHMTALFRAGRQAEALRAYQKTRAYLGDELGIEPSPELRELEQRILNQDESLLLARRKSIVKRAVLVADIDTLDGLSGLSPAERDRMIEGYGRTLDAAVGEAGGVVFAHRGSATYAVFETAPLAVAAAESTQKALAATTIGGPGLRMAIDIGDVETRSDDQITGPPVARSRGLVASAIGGQVLLSPAAHTDLALSREAGWQLKALGSHSIEGIGQETAVYQLVIPGLPDEFPPLRADGVSPGLPLEVTGLRGYELRNVVGRGTFGVVHRAYQASVGREVAVKVLRSDLANESEFIRRFEVEAQLVARLEHPHIVPLYDYWRDPDGAYLVLRWMRGGSLAEHLRRSSAMSLEAAADLVAHLAPALDVAHRAGVIHRDIKPSNVLLDGEGNFYLSDFGIAYDVVTSASSASETADPRTDVAGLGSVLRQALGNNVADAIAVVLATATAPEPRGRYETVTDFVSAWESALAAQGVDAASATFTPTRNPYKGLAAFQESDHEDFHGRGNVVEDLVDAVAQNRLVAVVGPSGIGKSSAVRAGLIPALRNGAVAGSASWLITDMVPGGYPFESLASALLRIAERYPSGLDEELRSDRRGLVRATKRLLPERSEALLVIDQLEELFTLDVEEGSAERFLNGLTDLINDSESSVRVVVTLRADFFDRPLRHAEFGELVRAATVPLSAPTGEDLTAIVQRPAENLGIGFESGLVERIVHDVSGQPAALPLLEFALTELFASRTSDVLTASSYESGGGVLGALAQRAEAVFEGLDAAGQEASRHVMLRLVNVSEASDATRRRVRRSELDRLDVPASAVDEVLGAFGAARLITFDRDPTTRGPTVEVAHESMFTQWERLSALIESHREDLVLSRRLSASVEDWESADRDRAYLASGGRLAQLESWAAATDLVLTSTEEDFLSASRDAEDSRIAARRRRRRAILAGFGAAAIVAMVLATVALVARNDAASKAELARSRQLAAAAIANLDRDPELSLLLGLEAAGADESWESDSAVREALVDHRAILTYTFPGDRIQDAVWGDLNPDGTLLAVGGVGDGLVQVTNVDSRQLMWEFDLGSDFTMGDGPFFADEGRQVVVPVYYTSEGPAPDGQGGFWFLDSADGSVVRRLPIGDCGVLSAGFWAHSDEFAYGVVPPCGALESAPPSDTPTLRIDLRTGEATVLVEGISFRAQAADRERRVILAGNQGNGRSMRVFEPATGTEVFALPNAERGNQVANISPDGRRIVYDLFPEPGLEVLDLETGTALSRYYGHSTVWNAWFSADGDIMYSTGGDGTLQLWEAETGRSILTIPFGEPVAWAAASSDLSRVAVFSLRDTVKVFDLQADLNPVVTDYWPKGCESAFIGTQMLQVVADTTAVTIGCGGEEFGRTYVYEAAEKPTFVGFLSADGNGVHLSTDGTLLAIQPMRDGLSSNVAVYDAATGAHVRDMQGLCPKDWYGHVADACRVHPEMPFPDLPTVLRFSPDGSQLAMAGGLSESATVWDVQSGAVLTNFYPGRIQLFAVEFSPGGEHLLVGTSSDLYLLSTTDWSVVGVRTWREEDGGAPAHTLRYTRDGSRIIAAAGALSGPPEIFVLDANTLETLRTIPETHDGGLWAFALSSGDTLIATAGTDGFVRVWNLRSGALHKEIPVDLQAGVSNVAFIKDDRELLVTARNGPVKVVTIASSDLLESAATRLTRGFTEAECRQYALDPCPPTPD